MLFAAAVIHLAANQSAIAADIARGPLPPVYIPPPAPIPYLWTGCYVGGNIGGAWSSVDLTNVTGENFSTSNGGFAVQKASATSAAQPVTVERRLNRPVVIP